MDSLRLKSSGTVLLVLLVSYTVQASEETIGVNGINSAGLSLPNGNPLTGAGIGIGQWEPFRPGDPSFDSIGSLFNSSVDPEEVSFVSFSNIGNPSSAPGNVNFGATINDPMGGNEIAVITKEHAVQVAGVIISTDTQLPGVPEATGVATGADLYSVGNNAALKKEEAAAFTAQYLAGKNGGDIRAVNVSFGDVLSGTNKPDGNSLLTQFVDWSAVEHDILYVVAGNQFDDQGVPQNFPIPSDNFNGITVGESEKESGGVYRKVSSGNDFSLDVDAEGDRTSVDILAPGVGVLLASRGNINKVDNGTSLAAPHVTGTVALLQEYGDFQIAAGAPNWTGLFEGKPTARRHEVMKAVLMNSADKLIDNGTVTVPGGLPIPPGGLLGMERTVLKQDGTSTWFDSFAYDDSVASGSGGFYPLDEEMGAGHLNAKQALDQFAAGEYEEFGVSGEKVPVIGWDYGTTTGDGDINRYRFNQELQAGSFISITLTWDRVVEFDVDNGTAGEYDIGDTFVEYDDSGFFPDDDVINDLDLYFQPAFSGNVNQARAFSVSGVGTVEQIFFQVETTGEFEFWVVQEDDDVGSNQNYAVAWEALGVGPLLAGDFDNDGDVDGFDFLAWQRNTNVGNLADWESEFGMTGGPLAAASAVPEPATGLLLLMGLGFALPFRSKRC